VAIGGSESPTPADSIDPSEDGSGSTNGSDNEPAELTYVDMATLLATF